MSLDLLEDDQNNPTFEGYDSHRLDWIWDRAEKVRDFFLDTVNHFTHLRVYRISVIHWLLLFIWASLVVSLTTVYGKLYSRSALVATLCSNVLLFGMSDILAQSIHCFLSYSLDPLGGVFQTTFIIPGLRDLNESSEEEEDNEDNRNTDNLSVFNDYGSPQVPEADLNPYEEADAAETHIFDFYRWICFMFWGFIISFAQVPWYKFLNFFYTEDPTIIQVLERVLSDQLLYSPISLYCFFMYSNYITESGDANTFVKKIQRLYISTLGCNYLVWPMVQLINFSIVPKHLQVPFSSTVGIFWNCFLSMRNSSRPLK